MTTEDGVSGDWDATQYHKLVEGVDSCSDTSPIKQDGVVCGPTLRLKSIDYERDVWLGSMLIVVRDAFDPSSPRAPRSHTSSVEARIQVSSKASFSTPITSVTTIPIRVCSSSTGTTLSSHWPTMKPSVNTQLPTKLKNIIGFSSQGEIRTVTLSLTLAMGFPSQLIQPSSRARCGTIFCKSMLMYTTM